MRLTAWRPQKTVNTEYRDILANAGGEYHLCILATDAGAALLAMRVEPAAQLVS